MAESWPQSPLHELQARLEPEVQKQRPFNQKFIPKDVLDEIVSQGNIVRLFSPAPTEDLIRYILEDARAIFATLISIDEIHRIQDLYRTNFKDEDLPVGAYGLARRVRSYRSEDNDRRDPSGIKWSVFEKFEEFAVSFCNKQWPFLAITFSDKQFEYKLHGRHPLPFINDEKQVFSGQFSTLQKVEIHQKHNTMTGLPSSVF